MPGQLHESLKASSPNEKPFSPTVVKPTCESLRKLREGPAKGLEKMKGLLNNPHIGSRVQPQQRQRWRVEMCIFEWCGVVIGGLIEPSAGSRRLWNPGFSRVEKVACR